MAAWPGTVNQFFYKSGYSQKPEPNKVSFQPEVGPPIERRRSSISTDIVQGRGRGTVTEFNNLMTFFRTTLRDGADTFTRNHPLTGTAGVTCRFIEPPAITDVRATYVQWSLEMRVYN